MLQIYENMKSVVDQLPDLEELATKLQVRSTARAGSVFEQTLDSQ